MRRPSTIKKIYKGSDFDPDIACDIVRDNLEDLSLALPKTNWWLFLENGATSQQVWAKNPTWLISHTFYRRRPPALFDFHKLPSLLCFSTFSTSFLKIFSFSSSPCWKWQFMNLPCIPSSYFCTNTIQLHMYSLSFSLSFCLLFFWIYPFGGYMWC